MTRLTERDIKMLTLNCSMATQRLSFELNMTVDAVNSRFEWLRKKKTENQTFINQLNNFEKMCNANKKRLISGKRKRIELEEAKEWKAQKVNWKHSIIPVFFFCSIWDSEVTESLKYGFVPNRTYTDMLRLGRAKS